MIEQKKTLLLIIIIIIIGFLRSKEYIGMALRFRRCHRRFRNVLVKRS